jgi:hypothetical protein
MQSSERNDTLYLFNFFAMSSAWSISSRVLITTKASEKEKDPDFSRALSFWRWRDEWRAKARIPADDEPLLHFRTLNRTGRDFLNIPFDHRSHA